MNFQKVRMHDYITYKYSQKPCHVINCANKVQFFNQVNKLTTAIGDDARCSTVIDADLQKMLMLLSRNCAADED